MTSMDSIRELIPAALPSAMADSTTLQLWAQDNAYGSDSTASSVYFKSFSAVQSAASDTERKAGTTLKDNRDNVNPAVSHILGGFSIVGDRPGLDTEGFARATAGRMAGAIAGAFLSRQATEIKGKLDYAAEASPQSNVCVADTNIIDAATFSQVAKQVLAKIDTGNTGLVTKAQLAAALQDPSFKGEAAQALVALYQNFDTIHDLSGHEHFWNSASITPGDLDCYQSASNQHYQRYQETSVLKEWAKHNLLRFTAPGCETITKGDIEEGLKQPHLRDNDRQMLNLLKKYYSDMDSMFNYSGLSEQDIDKLADGVWNDTAGKMVTGVFSSCYNVSNGAEKAGMCYDLYSDKDPLQSINADAIKQGSIGDCYYEAAVAAVAKSNPAAIRDCIRDNHNGTYTVTFPGASSEPITVNAPTEAELGGFNHGSKYGVWASVLEKAYGKYRDNHAWIGSYTPQEGADGGGLPGPVIKLLTGNDSDVLTVGDTASSDMASRLDAACKANKAIETGIDADASWRRIIGLSTDKTSDNFYKQHEYTIAGFEPDGKGGGTVIIRNPWGLTDGTPDGSVRIPLATFMKNFSDVTIQQ
jgi:hypothetical protein